MPISPEDKEALLKDDEFVAKILARQKPPESPKPPEKPGWQRFLETSGGTALITVLLGGMLGQLITWSFQQNQKEREFQQKWMEARGAQALVSYKEYLDKEQELMRRAYDLIGNCITASDNVLELTEAPEATNPEGVAQRKALVEGFNKASVEWDAETEKLELLISYYHKGQADLMRVWRELREGVSDYRSCAAEELAEYRKRAAAPRPGRAAAAEEAEAEPPGDEAEPPPLPCAEERKQLSRRITAFNSTLEVHRRYPWEGWNSPEELRHALDSKSTPTPAPAPAAASH